MTQQHTAASLATLITNRIEPDNAEEVLDALRPLDGHLITTRLLDKLPGGRTKWRLSRAMGWTEIRNVDYQTSQGSSPNGIRLTLANSEHATPLSVAFVERENPAYFAGRRERNKLRAIAIRDTPMLTRLAFVMNEIEDLNVRMAFARKSFAAFVEHGEPCEPDRYELERACGLREDK